MLSADTRSNWICDEEAKTHLKLPLSLKFEDIKTDSDISSLEFAELESSSNISVSFNIIVLPRVEFNGKTFSAPLIGFVRKITGDKDFSKFVSCYHEPSGHLPPVREDKSVLDGMNHELTENIAAPFESVSLHEISPASRVTEVDQESTPLVVKEVHISVSWHAGVETRRMDLKNSGPKNLRSSIRSRLLPKKSSSCCDHLSSVEDCCMCQRLICDSDTGSSAKARADQKYYSSPRATQGDLENYDRITLPQKATLTHCSGPNAEDFQSAFVTYDTDEPEFQVQQPLSSSLLGSDEDEEDPLYEFAFQFARTKGYGFVEFVDEKLDGPRPPKRSFNWRKSNLTSVNKDDRKYPLSTVISRQNDVKFRHKKCTGKPDGAFDRLLTEMFLQNLAERDMAVSERKRSDFGICKSRRIAAERSPDVTKLNSTQKSYPRLLSRSSVLLSEPPKSLIPESTDEVPERGEDVVQSYSVNKLKDYHSNRRQKVCSLQSPKRNDFRIWHSVSPRSRPTVVGDMLSTPKSLVDETGTLHICRSKSYELKTKKNINEQSNKAQPQEKHSKTKTNTKKSRHKLLEANASMNNAPGSAENTWTDVSDKSDEEPSCSSESDTRLPGLWEKTSLEYKLWNSLSATIFRETQLARMQYSDKLSTANIDVVHYSEKDENVSALSSSRISKRRRSLRRKMKRAHYGDSKTCFSLITCGRRRPTRGSLLAQRQISFDDARECKWAGNKEESWPRFVIQGMDGVKYDARAANPWHGCHRSRDIQRPLYTGGYSQRTRELEGDHLKEHIAPVSGEQSVAAGVCAEERNLKQDGGLKTIVKSYLDLRRGENTFETQPVFDKDVSEVINREKTCTDLFPVLWSEEVKKETRFIKGEEHVTDIRTPSATNSLLRATNDNGDADSEVEADSKVDSDCKANAELLSKCPSTRSEDFRPEAPSPEDRNNNASPELQKVPETSKRNNDRSPSPNQAQKHINFGGEHRKEKPLRLPSLRINSILPPCFQGELSAPSLKTSTKMTNKRQRKLQKHFSDLDPQRIETERLPDIPSGPENQRSRPVAPCNAARSRNKKRPPRLLSVPQRAQHFSEVADQSSLQAAELFSAGAKLEDSSMRVLNKSYVISGFETDNRDCISLSNPECPNPITTALNDSSNEDSYNSADYSNFGQCKGGDCHFPSVANQKNINFVSKETHENILLLGIQGQDSKEQCSTEGSNALTRHSSCFTCKKSRSYDVIPKPRKSLKSPGFAGRRKEREETRLSIGENFEPDLPEEVVRSFSEVCRASNEMEDINNNANDSSNNCSNASDGAFVDSFTEVLSAKNWGHGIHSSHGGPHRDRKRLSRKVKISQKQRQALGKRWSCITRRKRKTVSPGHSVYQNTNNSSRTSRCRTARTRRDKRTRGGGRRRKYVKSRSGYSQKRKTLAGKSKTPATNFSIRISKQARARQAREPCFFVTPEGYLYVIDKLKKRYTILQRRLCKAENSNYESLADAGNDDVETLVHNFRRLISRAPKQRLSNLRWILDDGGESEASHGQCNGASKRSSASALEGSAHSIKRDSSPGEYDAEQQMSVHRTQTLTSNHMQSPEHFHSRERQGKFYVGDRKTNVRSRNKHYHVDDSSSESDEEYERCWPSGAVTAATSRCCSCTESDISLKPLKHVDSLNLICKRLSSSKNASKNAYHREVSYIYDDICAVNSNNDSRYISFIDYSAQQIAEWMAPSVIVNGSGPIRPTSEFNITDEITESGTCLGPAEMLGKTRVASHETGEMGNTGIAAYTRSSKSDFKFAKMKENPGGFGNAVSSIPSCTGFHMKTKEHSNPANLSNQNINADYYLWGRTHCGEHVLRPPANQRSQLESAYFENYNRSLRDEMGRIGGRISVTATSASQRFPSEAKPFLCNVIQKGSSSRTSSISCGLPWDSLYKQLATAGTEKEDSTFTVLDGKSGVAQDNTDTHTWNDSLLRTNMCCPTTLSQPLTGKCRMAQKQEYDANIFVASKKEEFSSLASEISFPANQSLTDRVTTENMARATKMSKRINPSDESEHEDNDKISEPQNWDIKQPYLKVNTPGISMKWVSHVLEHPLPDCKSPQSVDSPNSFSQSTLHAPSATVLLVTPSETETQNGGSRESCSEMNVRGEKSGEFAPFTYSSTTTALVLEEKDSSSGSLTPKEPRERNNNNIRSAEAQFTTSKTSRLRESRVRQDCRNVFSQVQTRRSTSAYKTDKTRATGNTDAIPREINSHRDIREILAQNTQSNRRSGSQAVISDLHGVTLALIGSRKRPAQKCPFENTSPPRKIPRRRISFFC